MKLRITESAILLALSLVISIAATTQNGTLSVTLITLALLAIMMTTGKQGELGYALILLGVFSGYTLFGANSSSGILSISSGSLLIFLGGLFAIRRKGVARLRHVRGMGDIEVSLVVVLFVVIATGTAALLNGAPPQEAYSELHHWLVAYACLFVMILALPKPREVVKWVAIVATGVSIFGIMQHVLHWYPLPVDASLAYKLSYAGQTGTDPAVGLTGHSDAFGEILVPTIILTGALALDVKARLPVVVAIAAEGLALYWSYSKGGVYWVVIGLAIMLVGYRWRISWVWVVVALGIAAVLEYAVGMLLDPVNVEARLILLQASVNVLRQHPSVLLWGGGEAYIKSASALLGFGYPDAHNSYADVLLQYGVLGLVAVLGLLLVTFRSLWRRASDSVVGAAYAASYAALLGYITFEPALNENEFTRILLMLFVAVASTGVVLHKELASENTHGAPALLTAWR